MTKQNIISNILSDMITEIKKGRLTVSDAYKLSDKYATKIDNLYNSEKKQKKCFCGEKFDGVTCNSCGFDASEIDIY
jgi:hypothetical protein